MKLKLIYSEYQFEHPINKCSRVAVTTNERILQKTTKSLTGLFSATKPRNILNADILQIGMVDHYMILGIGKLNARKFRKKKLEYLKPAIVSNMMRNLSKII